MISVSVVEPDGRVVSTSGSSVVVSDTRTGVPLVLVRVVEGQIEYLSCADDGFESAMKQSMFPAQLAKAVKRVKK